MITIQPAFNNESIYRRQDELMLSWLWQAIVNGVNQQFGGGEEWERFAGQPDILYVIDGVGLYWNGEYVCNDSEVVGAGAALLALRGRIHLIFRSQEEYDRATQSIAIETADTDYLGDLDEHPF